MIRILKNIVVQDGEKTVRLSPAAEPTFSGEIDFDHPMIGRQTYATEIINGNFPHDLADCRTFGFEKEVEYLRSVGLARGGSLDNAIVLGNNGTILNPQGLRRADEFIRHKLLDAVGDLSLAGAPILGRYHGIRAGHDMNNRILHALFADRSAWEWTTDNVVPMNEHVPTQRASSRTRLIVILYINFPKGLQIQQLGSMVCVDYRRLHLMYRKSIVNLAHHKELSSRPRLPV